MSLSLIRKNVPAILFPILLIISSTLSAQQPASGTISGVVSDPSGEVVSQAVVSLTNQAQGTVRTFTTQNEGSFSFSTLEAANYRLVIASTGLTLYEQVVNLAVGQELRLSIQLQVAASHTTVEVGAEAEPAVNTTTSVVGSVIDSHQIDNLPLNGRNYLELSLLVPGNAPAPNFDPTKTNTVLISSAGQVGRGSNVTIDGADNNDDAVGGSLVNIPEDAVQEFQIATNRFSASLGVPDHLLRT